METARSMRSPDPAAPAPAGPTPDVPGAAAAPSPPAVPVPAVAPAPRRGRRPFLILAVVAAVALVAIGLYSVLTAGREETDDAQVSADMVPVGTRVAGVVARVRIQENQRVKRGDLLVEIDPADYAARVQQAEGELATARAQAEAAAAQVQIVEATSRGG